MKLIRTTNWLVALCLISLIGCGDGMVRSSPDRSESQLVGKLYREARAQLIRVGWVPKVSSVEGPDGPEREWLTAGEFLALGYVEIQQCAGTGLTPCIFDFAREGGRCLRITTLGEAPDATVSHVENLCSTE